METCYRRAFDLSPDHLDAVCEWAEFQLRERDVQDDPSSTSRRFEEVAKRLVRVLEILVSRIRTAERATSTSLPSFTTDSKIRWTNLRK